MTAGEAIPSAAPDSSEDTEQVGVIPPGSAPSPLHLEFCGEWVELPPDGSFTMGREGDFVVDENQYLHRRFLEVRHDRLWWITNRGSHLSATLSDPAGTIQSWLAPGASLPLVLGVTLVRFTAGPTFYELALHLEEPPMVVAPTHAAPFDANRTVHLELTAEQRLLVLALAERSLLRPGTGFAEVPSSEAAAARLGWSMTKFNRKLDNVCQKLTQTGVRGLHGDASQLASGRRGRLIEYALSTRLVTAEDLSLLPG